MSKRLAVARCTCVFWLALSEKYPAQSVHDISVQFLIWIYFAFHFLKYPLFIVCAVKTKKVWTWNLIISALNIPQNHAFQLILQGFFARFAKVARHKIGRFAYGLYKVRAAFLCLLVLIIFWHIHKSPLHEKRAYRVISIRPLLIVAVCSLIRMKLTLRFPAYILVAYCQIKVNRAKKCCINATDKRGNGHGKKTVLSENSVRCWLQIQCWQCGKVIFYLWLAFLLLVKK